MNENQWLGPLCCPVCGQGLAHVASSLVCANRHSFDIAREGYVNLLLGGAKRPKYQGDTKVMFQARRRFLELGHYEPLLRLVQQVVAEHVWGQTAVSILDAGCGEGWYLGQLQQQLADISCCFYGLDIAKTGVQMAAKRHPTAKFIVADIWQKIPLADNSITVLLNLFAPRNPAEFARILSANSLLLVVIPQAHHLQPLRDKLGLLDIEAEKQQKVVAQLADGFSLQSSQSLSFQMDLDYAALTNLVQMTPNYWHLTTAVQDKLSELANMSVTAAFELLAFRR